ncbi:MAG: hypothetical protein RML94_07835 [Bacteroidia bacterium]|nr:hypothetical protein [Bacteroidia bacterium]
MQRVRQQCGAQRSTEAIAQPVARRPEAQRRDTPKKIIYFISCFLLVKSLWLPISLQNKLYFCLHEIVAKGF